jgi:predicted MFS family arabinose efflux permease
MTADPSASRPTPPELTRAEWGLILVLVAVQFTHMVDFVIVMPLGDRLIRELQITEPQFGWIVSVYAWAAGIASLLASAVMDRFDRRKVLLVMYAGFTVSTLLCGLADSYPMMLVARTLAGVFGGLAAVTLMAIIGDVIEPAKRGRAIGAVTSSFAVASIAGLPAGLWLANHFGRGAPFLALGVFSAGVLLTAWWRLPAVRGHLTAERPGRWTEFADILREPGHRWAFLFSFFLVLGTFTVASFIGPYFISLNGWTEADLAWIYLVAGLCTLVGMNVVGRLADRVPRRPLFRVIGFAALVMAVVVTNLPQSSLWVAAVVLSGFMVAAAGRMVPATAIMLGVARPENRGGFMSLNTAVQHLSTGIAPMIAGALLYRTDDGKLAGFPLVGVVAAGAAAVSLVLAGLLRPAPATTIRVAERAPELEVSDAVPEPKPAV